MNQINKSSSYVWLSVILANIFTIIFIALVIIDQMRAYANNIENFQYITLFTSPWIYELLLASIIVTVLPVLLSRSDYKYKNQIGYGIPSIGLLLVIYFAYDSYTCTGKMCGLTSFIYGLLSLIIAILISVFYSIGKYAQKYSDKFMIYVLWIEVFIIVITSLYLGNLFLFRI